MSTKHGIWQERVRVFAFWIYLAPFQSGFYVILLNKRPMDRKFDPKHVVGTYFDRQLDKDKVLKEAKKFILENYQGVSWIEDVPVDDVRKEVA